MKRIRRRELLAWSAAAVGAASCARPSTGSIQAPPKPPKRSGPPRVIVIGGGLSGLAAADELADHRFEVTVLEAQARPGGRILTIRSPFRDGLYVEAGATHVVGDPNLVALLDKLRVERDMPKRPPQLALVRVLGGRRTVYPPGTEPPEDATFTAEEKALDFPGRLEKFSAPAAHTDSRAADWPPRDLQRFDVMSAAEYLASLDVSAAFRQETLDFCANGDLGGISALAMMREAMNILYEIRNTPRVGRIVGGTDKIPTALAARLGKQVILGAEVRAVTQRNDEVRVDFVRRGASENLVADFVICAVPSPLVGKIAFDPPLSREKRRAVAELPLAHVGRIYLESNRRFWSERGESGNASTDLSIGRVRDETVLQDGAAGVLGAYLSGDKARRYAALGEADRIKQALADVEIAHPGMKDHFGHGLTKFWAEDPYARGAYAWYRPGQLTQHARAIAAAEGRIHFAGDHTSYRPGFMHGALASSKRVVGEIENAWRNRPI